MKIAIVGAEESKWTKIQKTKVIARIRGILCNHSNEDLSNPWKDVVFVSGHCYRGGVDIWGEQESHAYGIKQELYPAEAHQWTDIDYIKQPEDVQVFKRGYRSRNIQIAEACDVLYDIEPAGSCWRCHGTGYSVAGFLKLEKLKCDWCEGDGAYSGATWTYKYARKIGKECHKIIIPIET